MPAAPDLPPRDEDRITISVNGAAYAGWLQSEVQRDLETLAGIASIPVSMIPGQPPDIKRQDKAEVRIGQTLVMTGFVMAAAPFYRRADCGMRVQVRDRTGDLVRSSAIYQGGHWRKATLERICRDLAGPFGIDVVVAPGVEVGDPIADFRLWHGETVLDAMARAARLRGVLLSRDQTSRVLLTRAGLERFAGAIIRGQNAIAMDDVGSDEGRHSEYRAYGQSNVSSGNWEAAWGIKAVARDEEVKRYLPLVINADGNTTQADLQRLVDHTARVRRGHSMGLRYLIEGWTWAGQSWPINQRVQVFDDMAGVDGKEWLIVRTRQTCDVHEGTMTELLLRPIEAYDTVPLKTKRKIRRWGGSEHSGDRVSGPTDKARQ